MHSNKESILIIIPISPFLNAGGAKQGLNFGLFLRKKGHSVTIIIPDRPRNKEVKTPVNIQFILYFRNNIITKGISFFLFVIPSYIKYISKNNIIYVYGGNIIGVEAIIFLGKILKKKVIFRSTMLGEDDFDTIFRSKPKRLKKYIFDTLDIYHSLSPEFTNKWKKYFPPQKVIQVMQGVNTDEYRPVSKKEKDLLRKKMNIPVSLPVFISIGYLIRRKGYAEIFRELSTIKSPFKYFVIGDYFVSSEHYLFSHSAEMQELYRLAKELLGEKIHFTGSTHMIGKYLAVSDIFILNSSQEGIPNALLEAMSCGLCPVVKQLPGLEEYLLFNGINAITFENTNHLHNLLNELLENPDKCRFIGINARKHILKTASFENVYNTIFNQFREHP